MKLFTKGKMFESLDTMAVTGENDEELYYLKKDTSSAGHVVTLSGADGGKIADIEQRGNGGKASFAVIMNGRKLRWWKENLRFSPDTPSKDRAGRWTAACSAPNIK